jgi:hypothetical protein
MYGNQRNQLIQEANDIESVTDEAAEGGRYVFVNPKRLRAIRRTEDVLNGAPSREIEDRPTTKMPRLERPERPELPTVKMPQLVRHPDPKLCECDQMYDALRQRVLDVAYLGPIFLVPIVANDAALLRGSVSIESAEQTMKRMVAVRHCPFDGTLMDVNVEIRPYEPVDDELPSCCDAMADLVRAGRIEIPAFKVGAISLTRLLTADGGRLPMLHCPFCGTDTIDTILMRYKRQLGA